ncbi:MAG: aldo/keto reductase [Pseudohongiella sp.]|nr:aldo/keto reductase [Pseudohongiella sp.]
MKVLSRHEIVVPRRALGDTGLEVSCLGLGTVKFGRNEGVKYPTGFDLPDDKQVRDILALAHEIGINLLDTAPAYGTSEERLGKLLANRQEWILCSKTGEEFVNGQSHFDFSAKHTRLSIERSLKRLRTDYLDMVLVHSDGNDELIIQQTDCFETLLKLKQKGLIRAFGLSGKTVAGGLLALQYADAVMVTFNPSETGEREVIRHAHKLGKAVLIKKAFNSGHAVIAGGATNNTAEKQQAGSTNPPSDPAQDSLRFVLSEPGVSSVIVGTINSHHLQANAIAAQTAPALA